MSLDHTTTSQQSWPQDSHAGRVSSAATTAPVGLVALMIVAGALGLWAAFQLTLDKLAILENPEVDLSCNFSVLVGCSANLTSWQGELFGFPNPLIGVVGWTVMITVGVMLASRVSPPRWLWIALNVGITAALALVGFLIFQSIFVLGVLCPYCMLTWAATISLFWAITLHNLARGYIPAPRRVRDVAATGYDFVLLITVACYVLIAGIAQWQLDWLDRIV